MLVTAVRDATLQIYEADHSLLAAELVILERQEWRVFVRLALHLLCVIGEAPLDVLVPKVEDPELFRRFPREYALLLEASAHRLPEATRQKLLEWLERGPDVEQIKKTHEHWTGQKPTDEETGHWVRQWQLKRLASLKRALPETWRHRLEALVAELGEPSERRPDEMSGGWVGSGRGSGHSPRESLRRRAWGVLCRPPLRRIQRALRMRPSSSNSLTPHM
jgi:hypothetical protein